VTTLGPPKVGLSKAIAVAQKHRLVQFGQASDDAAWDGRTACTHVVCQLLALVWKDRLLTINQVNQLAGMPYRAGVRLPNGSTRPRGMNNLEFQRFCDRLGLPYEVRFGLSYETVLRWSNRAPVFYGMRYENAPRQKGYHYQGRVAQPPYAIENGATQLGSNVGRHAVLLLGYRSVLGANGTPVGYRQWRCEPNHGSSARPERPPYDIITTQQGKAEYLQYATVSPRVYCALPTRSLI
jgi:hypothetical protein